MKPNQTHSQTHTRNTTEREIARGKQSMRDRDQEVLTYDGWQRGSRWWRWQSVLEATVASMRGSGGGVVLRVRVCLRVQRREWLIWASVERSELQLRVRVFLFLRVSFSRVWCLGFLFFYYVFYFFIYTKLRAAFYETQLCMNWSCVLLNAAL